MTRDAREARPGSATATTAADPTRVPGLRASDLVFGILLPIVCLVLDPGIVRTRGLGDAVLGGYVAATYTFIGSEIVVLSIWLAGRKGAVVVAVPLLLGGIVALGVGVVLLPLSIPMSIVGIGLLGLVPFGTAVVFFRQSTYARRAAAARRAPPLARAAAVGLTAVIVALPVVMQRTVDARTRELLAAAQSGDPRREADAIARLRPLGWMTDSTEIAALWRRSNDDPGLMARLVRVWFEATGQDLVRTID